ncbi:hypothetical protein BS50DRAFT_508987, partial [Corynespora cassiicola Philippines]
MEAWVNRPAHIRQGETAKRNGHVARPMNPFMLYRSAYFSIAGQWCSQSNSSVISSICGQSWLLEPPKVRRRYKMYAEKERSNHLEVYPDYKFNP